MLTKSLMVCAALLSAATLYAEPAGTDENSFSGDSLNVRTDTTSAKTYHFGKRDVIFDASGIHFIKDRSNFDQSFYDDDQRSPFQQNYYQNNTNGSESSQSKPKPKKYRHFSSSLSAFDIGMAHFASEPLSVEIDNSASYMDLSRGFQLAFCNAAGLPIISQDRFKLGMGVGVGAKMDFYTFSDKKLKLDKENGHLIHYSDTTKPYKKSKLTNTYLTVPVALEVHYRGLSVLAGVEGNMLVWSNTKMKTSSGEKKERNHSNFCQNMFGYNLIAKVLVDEIGIYARANMTSLFTDGKGPELYPFSVGLSFWF